MTGTLLPLPYLELARIGSLLFIFADSPSYQTGSSSPIDTFATRLSAQPLSWTLAFTPHNKPRRLDVPGTLLGLLPSQLAAPIRKKSLLETTILCVPAPGHRRRSDGSCRTRPLCG